VQTGSQHVVVVMCPSIEETIQTNSFTSPCG